MLKHNLDIYRQRFESARNKPYPHMDLNNPELNFPDMAQGMGAAGEVVEDPTEVGPAIARAFAANAPRVVEIVISRKP